MISFNVVITYNQEVFTKTLGKVVKTLLSVQTDLGLKTCRLKPSSMFQLILFQVLLVFIVLELHCLVSSFSLKHPDIFATPVF